MKKVKVLKVNPIQVSWIHEGHDTDRDKVPNFRDCNPWNPHQQGWFHDFLKSFKSERKPQGTDYQNTHQEIFDREKRNVQLEKEMKKQQEIKSVYIYAKLGDPRFKGGLKWYFVGGVSVDEVGEVLNQLGRRDDVFGLEYSDKPNMEGYFNRRDFKQAKKQYVENRGWKENVSKGLESREVRERKKTLLKYGQIMALERAITGAPQVFVHSGDEFIGLVRRKKPIRRKVYTTFRPRYNDSGGEV